MKTVCYSAIICKRSQEDGGARVGPADRRREGGFGLSLLVLNQNEGALSHLSLSFFPVVETTLRVDVAVLKARAKLLQKYLCDEQKELQALYALQALVVTLEQPPSKSQAGGLGVGWKNCQKAGTVMERWVVIGEQNALMVNSFPL